MKHPRDFHGKTYSPINPELPQAERNRTRRATSRAVKAGRIAKPASCQECGRGNLRIEAHHPDYRDHMNVMWLCRWCHWREHARVSDEAGFGLWRRTKARRDRINAEREAERQRLLEKWRPLFEAQAAARREKLEQIEKRNAVIVEMIASGATVTEIARRIDLSLSATSHYMRRHGLRDTVITDRRSCRTRPLPSALRA